MKVNGTATLGAPKGQVWEALQDPAVLVRTIPGCLQLETVGPDEYRMTVTAGVASIKGTYLGDVKLTEQHPPGSFVLRARGAGSPGTVDANVRVTLEDLDGRRTRLDYHADAVVGGMIGGVGQRVLAGVAKRTAGEFFSNVDAVLARAGLPAAPGAAGGEAVTVPATAVPAGAAADVPAGAAPDTAARTEVYEAPRPAPGGGLRSDFAKGALFGAGVALLGALIGGIIARGAAD
ncbi:MAG: SRPBCC family protein [Streptomycetales bacterium]